MKVFILSLLATVIAAPITAQAKPFDHRPHASINQRQVHQDFRVAQGVRSGALTGRELIKLERQDDRIAATEARMRADDGGLSRRERARLQVALNRQSQAIYSQKHDAQTRPRTPR